MYTCSAQQRWRLLGSGPKDFIDPSESPSTAVTTLTELLFVEKQLDIDARYVLDSKIIEFCCCFDVTYYVAVII